VDQPQIQHPEIPNNIRDLLSILLTCAAGRMDALSLFGLGWVFASGLSGNTIVLGLRRTMYQLSATCNDKRNEVA
jgi:Protein of unknown function (DUF1275)